MLIKVLTGAEHFVLGLLVLPLTVSAVKMLSF